jgi:glycosyltransferase involved in cell wall biosynthesis
VITPEHPSGRLVLLVTNIPTPYRIPLFNEIARQLENMGYRFHVVFGAAGYARRRWTINMAECGFSYTVLAKGNAPTAGKERGLFLYPGLTRLMRTVRPRLVVTGGFGAATIKVWLRCRLSDTKYVIWSGAVMFEGMRESRWRRALRRCLVRGASACVAYGTDARAYLIGCGADPERVAIGVNTVDVGFFAHRAAGVRAEGPKTLAEGRVVYVGELSPRKGVDQVLRVAAELRRTHPEVKFDIVGSGTEEGRLKAMAAELGIAGQVVFHGFKQKAEIAELLGRASCFLFCTNFDIWGLVLVEAMAAGLVCLASVRAGATADLIRDGVTGFAVDFQDTKAVAGRLTWILDHPVECEVIGREAQRFIQEEVSIEKSASGFVQAVLRASPLPEIGAGQLAAQ